MKCQKCGYALPDDSEFCQYCGSKLYVADENIAVPDIPIAELPDSADVQQPSQESSTASDIEDALPPQKESESASSAAVPENHDTAPTLDISGLKATPNETPVDNHKKKFCKFCGGLIDTDTKKCSSCGKQFFRYPKRIVGIIALLIVFVALTGLNIYQYVSNDATISDLEQQIEARDSTISTQGSTIATQKSKIAGLEDKAEYYDEICSFLSRGNIGYAADNFKSSDSIILVRKGETNRKFTLTAYWSNGGTVSTSYSSFLVAGVSFDNDNWSRSTTMTINPRAEGINVITFTNDVDSKTFKIMIIVTE